MKTAICAIVCNEGRYLVEWMAYHLSIGFDHLYIYNNDSTDNTPALLQYAQEQGVCSWIDFPRQDEKDRPQPRAYRHFAQNYALNYDWVMFLDADEFVNFKRHNSVKEFLADYPDADAIGINWRVFGDNGRKTYTPEMVLQRFCKAAKLEFEPNHLVKSIVRSSALVEPGIHAPKLREGSVFVNAEMIPLKPFPDRLQDVIHHDVVQINHYFCKTFEEWQNKQARGRATVAKSDALYKRRDEVFHAHNRNDEVDVSILRHLGEAVRLMITLFPYEQVPKELEKLPALFNSNTSV